MRKTTVIAMMGLGFLSSMARAALEVPARVERKGAQATVRFSPPQGLHFNLESPNQATVGDSPAALRIAPGEVSVTLPARAKAFEVALYLCEDGGTVCRAYRRSLAIDGDRVVARDAARPPAAAARAGEGRRGAHGWHTQAADALARAKAERKPLLIGFFAIWCPPCNQLKETVFPTARFQQAAEKFVLLALDADSEASWEQKERYKVAGYPTVVFASADGDEVFRLVGARPADEFVARMDEAFASRERSRSALERLARRGDLAADRKLAGLQLEVGEHAAVARRFERRARELERTWTVEDARLLARARVAAAKRAAKKGGAAKAAYIAELERALAGDVTEALALEWANALVDEADDDAVKRRAAQRELAAVANLEKDPAALAREGLCAGDLYEYKGSALADLKRAAEARAAYATGAEKYAELARASGLAPVKARGFMLERAFCLGKAGRVAEARALYDELEAAYPEEFTFPFAHAGLLDRQGDAAGALNYARRALERSYGDNRLRAAERVGKLLQKLSRTGEAKRVVDRVLATTPAPADRENRTHRYIEALRDLRKKLADARRG